ncbi:YdcF family protein, partial [Mesorhizobium sp. M7A.F.Ca.CA.002.14.1.2]
MFFYLSKIFWFFIQPLNLAIFLLLAGLLAVTIGRRRLAAAGSVLAFLILALSAWTSLGAMMLNPLEERFQRPPLPEKVDGIVVLGGGFEGAINLARGGYELNSSGDRMVETAILARRFPTAKVVVSGGTGAVAASPSPSRNNAPRLL